MYTGTLINELTDMAERVRVAAVPPRERVDAAGSYGSRSKSEKFAQPLGLSPADRDLGLFFIVHSQLVRAFEPGHDFADTIDVHQVRAVGPPK